MADGTTLELAMEPEEDLNESLPTEPRERKRVLNVLAQRRYRNDFYTFLGEANSSAVGRRKKQRQVMLEDMLAKSSGEQKGSRPSQALLEDPPTTTGNSNDAARHETGFGPSTTSDIPSSGQSVAWISSPDQTTIESPNSSASSWLTLALAAEDASAGENPSPLDFSTAGLSNLSDFLQEDDTQNTTFPDDFWLQVSELDLLRASFDLATRLRCADRLWDLSASSVFLETDAATWMSLLPANLQPTPKQLTVAHHPIIDLLPWPTVRNKLIEMYCMPVHFWPRHPDDGSPCSLVRLVYDMEDGGIRLWGADPAAADAWEVQERFAMTWWWALDHRVLRGTNQRRLARGETPLPGPVTEVA